MSYSRLDYQKVNQKNLKEENHGMEEVEPILLLLAGETNLEENLVVKVLAEV